MRWSPPTPTSRPHSRPGRAAPPEPSEPPPSSPTPRPLPTTPSALPTWRSRHRLRSALTPALTALPNLCPARGSFPGTRSTTWASPPKTRPSRHRLGSRRSASSGSVRRPTSCRRSDPRPPATHTTTTSCLTASVHKTHEPAVHKAHEPAVHKTHEPAVHKTHEPGDLSQARIVRHHCHSQFTTR